MGRVQHRMARAGSALCLHRLSLCIWGRLLQDYNNSLLIVFQCVLSWFFAQTSKLFEVEQILDVHPSALFIERKLGKVGMWDCFLSSSW